MLRGVYYMIIPKIAICPICGKKTYLRIEDGGYLKEYPIRFHCMNCRALIKGVYIMGNVDGRYGLHLYNAVTEECEVDSSARKIRNADYVIDISGELPCKMVRYFDGNLISSSPFLEAAGQVDMQERIQRLQLFNYNMDEWRKWRSIAFQLLDEGSIEYISTALHNKMGEYTYQCNHYLKSLHCLQEVVQEETKSLFYQPTQEEVIKLLLSELSEIDRQALHELVVQIGGLQVVISYYKKIIDVFSSFMEIYPNILPAETYLRYKEKVQTDVGIATCSFSDIKTFYQDAYESILSLAFIPVCLDNILIRGNYQSFNKLYDYLFRRKKYAVLDNDYYRYIALDNGMKLEKLNDAEPVQCFLNIPANRFLRNGIGHNNISYDGLTQEITIYDQSNPSVIKLRKQLMDMAIDCIGLTKTAVIVAEILLFILRQEVEKEGIHSIIHPKFYKGIQPNDKCVCGSNKKYKKCCKNEVEDILIKYQKNILKHE